MGWIVQTQELMEQKKVMMMIMMMGGGWGGYRDQTDGGWCGGDGTYVYGGGRGSSDQVEEKHKYEMNELQVEESDGMADGAYG